MPGGDGTGPFGLGSRSGRALGYCTGYPFPGFGAGRGRGFRRFWRTCYPYPPFWGTDYPYSPYPYADVAQYQVDPKDEMKYLENSAETLKKELDAIEKRISELSQKV